MKTFKNFLNKLVQFGVGIFTISLNRLTLNEEMEDEMYQEYASNKGIGPWL